MKDIKDNLSEVSNAIKEFNGQILLLEGNVMRLRRLLEINSADIKIQKIDQMLCENIIDEVNADIDWENVEGETGLKNSILQISNKNEEILNYLRGEKNA